MNSKVLKTLEYDKIIARLTEYAQSAPGKALCSALLPSSDLKEIVTAQQNTADAADRVRMKGSLSFSGVKDIGASLKRLDIGSTLNTAELLAVGGLLTAANRAAEYGAREKSDEVPDDSLDAMFREIDPLPKLAAEIRRCIISEEEIADEASPGLAKVRRSMKLIDGRVHAQLQAVLNSSRSYLQDGIITMRDGRYCLPVKAEYKSQFPGMVHDQSATGSTVFIEPMAVIKLNNELRELEIQEKREIEYVLKVLSAEVEPVTGILMEDLRLLSELDFIFAKAGLARHYRAVMPKFNTRRYIDIREGRHPLLDPKAVVPVNIYLGDAFDQLIITGPNTGGKTVSLKTVGLFTLMGQAGLHIPAFEGSELAVFEEVFADIGDEQSIEQNLSTFSSHMTNIVNILAKADSYSLCLFDELCAGTDPAEGAALAMSILSFLHKMTCRTVATTHYSELKVYALQTNKVENACCEFDVETLRPTYRLLIGIPGKSNAFAISRKLGLPDYLIDDAKKHISAEEESFEDILADLEEKRVTIEKERAEIASYKEQVETLKKRLAAREEKLSEREEKALSRAKEEARRILEEAKTQADETIRNVNRLASQSGVTKELEAERARIREKLAAAEKAAAAKKAGKDGEKPRKVPKPEEIRKGDTVFVHSMNLKGTVTSLPNAKGDLSVQMGILNSVVNINDLELMEEDTVTGPGLEFSGSGKKKGGFSRSGGSGKPGGSGQSAIRMSKSYSVSTEVNLIGMTVDEAIPTMEKYLDDAYIAHLPEVRVIHGRGTGALKKAVHQRLRQLKYVKEFRLGEFGEGGTGATVVTFK